MIGELLLISRVALIAGESPGRALDRRADPLIHRGLRDGVAAGSQAREDEGTREKEPPSAGAGGGIAGGGTAGGVAPGRGSWRQAYSHAAKEVQSIVMSHRPMKKKLLPPR